MRTIGTGPRSFPQISAQLLNKPLAIHPHKAEVLMCAMQQKLGLVSLKTIDGVTLEAKEMVERAALARDASRPGASGRSFHMDGDIAVIHIEGTLVHKYGFLDPVSGFTGYDGLTTKLTDAVRDPDVLGIWLDIDSPGGAVSGLFAFVQKLAAATQASGKKPIYAYINEQACSAAYAIASVCDKVYGPQDATLGSIGCVMIHTSFADALEENGIQATVIRSGERKYRGNMYENLDETTLAKFQQSVDGVRNRFANLVAMGRGISVQAAMATEAEWFEGDGGVEAGLMDAVITEDEAWSRLEEETDRIKRERRAAA